MSRTSAAQRRRPSGRVHLRIDLLERRDVPSTTLPPVNSVDIQATVFAGDPLGDPSDSIEQRLDPNTKESPFAGVGSLSISTKRTSLVGTASAISRWHVLTAAHTVDINNDGKVNARDGLTGVYFVLNFGADISHRIAVTSFRVQPHFTGFNRPAVNDDLAVLTLAEELPEDLPIYRLPDFDLSTNTVVTMVGYGRSGNGIEGYQTLPSLTEKRVGQNTVDAFYGQDDRRQPFANEVFRFDFDGPVGNGPLGGPSLGNQSETQLGAGDSGGPSFVESEGGWTIVGVNTYIQGAHAPLFSSMGGGTNVFPYRQFIESIINPQSTPDSSWIDILPFVPGLGSALPPPGIRIGAKPVSGEFAREAASAGPTTLHAPWGSASYANESDEKDEAALAVTLLTESEEQGPSLDTAIQVAAVPTLTDSPLSLDAGLLAFAAGAADMLSD